MPSSVPLGRVSPLSCLLLVSHPDDDAIFAGALQRSSMRHLWSVICVTHDRASPRAEEMVRWQTSLGTPPERLYFLGYEDDPEDRRQGRCSLEESVVSASVRELDLRPDLVVTHNVHGEYGHPHHRLVHRIGVALFPRVPRLVFAHGLPHADLVLSCADKWEAAAEAYASQQTVLASLHHGTETFVAEPRAAALALAAQLVA